MKINKPMLAVRFKNLQELTYPLFASPKLDGVRALTRGGILVSRTLKPIPNAHIQKLAKGLPEGLDGELILENGTPAGALFGDTTSAVMRVEGEPNVMYHVFDYVTTNLLAPASTRQDDLNAFFDLYEGEFLDVVPQILVTSAEEAQKVWDIFMASGYEGMMLRSPDGPYKEGRSTLVEGYLLKGKLTDDSEAKILAFEEKMHNANVAEVDLLGHTKRSQAKAGLQPAGTLGKLYVVDLYSKVEFEIGTGFDDALRLAIWNNRQSYIGKIVKYKFQPHGVKEKPRFPVFIGFRDEADL